MSKKFVMSYSFGKDSTLSLDRMMSKGHVPVALLVMVKKSEERSYFHGVNNSLMEKISKSLDIPLLIGESVGTDYKEVMVEKLKEAKSLGAEVAVFGDIDIEQHFDWCSQRCKEAEIDYKFPLWQEEREDILKEILEKGYKCIVKVINNNLLPNHILGKPIDNQMVKIFRECKVDVCGENGEYHTAVVGGPIFHTCVEYEISGIVSNENHSFVDLI